MSKKVGVLFSGGLDSTYLVWKNLKDGNEVVPIYIEITNNTTKTILEKNRIELLFKEFADEYNTEDNHKIDCIQYVVQVGVCASEDSLYFKQVPVWIVGLMFCQSMGVDELQIGYVGNDDAISYLDDIKKIYKSYGSIQEKLTPLTFPLMKERKLELGHELPERYREFIFSCENATIIGSETAEFIEYKPCCTCGACRTIVHTEYYGLGFPKKYMERLTKLKIQDLSRLGYKITDEKGNDVDGWDKYGGEVKAPEPYQLYIPYEEDLNIEGIDLRKKAEAVKEY